MSNLQDELKTLFIAYKIDKYYEDNTSPRTYLGLSQIGHSCPLYLWLCHNKYKQISIHGQTLRLFEHGNKVEDWIISDLLKVGYRVYGQQREVMFEDKEIKLYGHIDGIIEGLEESFKPHLLECKSANDKKFHELIKLNSYEAWNEGYKTQIQVYMLGLELERCLAIVYNKNTSEIYSERIKLDKSYAIQKLEHVFNILANPKPENKCPRADWWEAKFCGFYNECFGTPN